MLSNGIYSLINGLSNLIKKLVSVKDPLQTFQNIKQIDAILSSTYNMAISFGVLATGVISFITNFNKLSDSAKTWIPVLSALAGVIAGVAIAFAGFSFRSALVAGSIVSGIALTVSSLASASKYEKGGIPKQGSLFFAGEGKGAELLGNVGGRTNVINEGQLGQVLYNAVKRANSEAKETPNRKTQVTLNVNGRRLAESVFNDFNYVGKINTGKEWGNN